MQIAIEAHSGIQLDVIAKARKVVEEAQRSALILIKAQEAAKAAE